MIILLYAYKQSHWINRYEKKKWPSIKMHIYFPSKNFQHPLNVNKERIKFKKKKITVRRRNFHLAEEMTISIYLSN